MINFDYLSLLVIMFSIASSYFVNLYIVSNNLFLSVPSNRDMHKKTVSSLGGISVFVSLIILLILYFSLETEFNLLAIVLSTIIIFSLGVFDDLYNLQKSLRIMIQYLASFILLNFMFQFDYTQSLLYSAIFIYLINTYNFMDGIDCLAINQYIFICVALAIHQPVEPSLSFINPIYLSPIIIGFYFFNLSPARIFLGNSGSYLLGFLVSIFYIDAYENNYISIYIILIIHSVFIVDTMFTLFIRFISHLSSINKLNSKYLSNIIKSLLYITSPHKLHAYQKICQLNSSHMKTSFGILLYNLFWLLPLSLLSAHNTNFSFIILILAFLPYLSICIFYKAGVQKLD